MTLLRRANEQSEQDWRPVAEGLWRWIVGKPELKLSEKFGNYQVRFPLELTQPERDRLLKEYPIQKTAENEGIQQSWRTLYSCGLSLGYVKKDGQYQTTKLIDFIASTLGNSNSKRFREWIAGGGGPPRPADKGDQQAELRLIEGWLTWFENMELYGSIRHETGDDGRIWARFGGPMPVGSLPGQKDDDYQALGRGKLRAIIAENTGVSPQEPETREPALVGTAPQKKSYEEVFGKEEEMPF